MEETRKTGKAPGAERSGHQSRQEAYYITVAFPIHREVTGIWVERWGWTGPDSSDKELGGSCVPEPGCGMSEANPRSEHQGFLLLPTRISGNILRYVRVI